MDQRQLSPLAFPWTLRITPQKAGFSGVLAKIDGDGGPMLRVESGAEGLRVEVHTRLSEPTPRAPGQLALTFTVTDPEGIREGEPFAVTLREAGVILWKGETLVDQEWTVGGLAAGPWTLESAPGVSCQIEEGDADVMETEQTFTGPAQFFVPPGHNGGVGDCMPFARDGRYCLYYLMDRRGHQSKLGLGAHEWAQISSADLKTWTIHPMALSITEQWEGSLCTGSLIQKDGKTYAFYAARMTDHSPARLTWAESEDGVTFTKSEKYFALTAPYEPVSARDPMVFLGEDGLYHMLVTTSLAEGGRYGGCLAHLTSADLFDWKQLEPLLVPGYADQPECADYFAWNGWYYLVFSNFGTARYRMSKSPFGPWIRPRYDLLDAPEVRVPKTAAFGDRRLTTGFLTRYPSTYAGNAIFHELTQNADGTLGIRFPEELLPPAVRMAAVQEATLSAPEGRQERLLHTGREAFRLRLTLEPQGEAALYGLSLEIGGEEHRLDLDPVARTCCLLRPGETFAMGSARQRVYDLSLTGPVTLDAVLWEDILDVLLPDGRVLTGRLTQNIREGFTLKAYVQCGGLRVASGSVDLLAP